MPPEPLPQQDNPKHDPTPQCPTGSWQNFIEPNPYLTLLNQTQPRLHGTQLHFTAALPEPYFDTPDLTPPVHYAHPAAHSRYRAELHSAKPGFTCAGLHMN